MCLVVLFFSGALLVAGEGSGGGGPKLYLGGEGSSGGGPRYSYSEEGTN